MMNVHWSKIRCSFRTPFGYHFCVSFLSVLWLTFFSLAFSSWVSLIIINHFVPPFDDDDFEGLRISVFAKREGVCGSFSLSLEFCFFEKKSATRKRVL